MSGQSHLYDVNHYHHLVILTVLFRIFCLLFLVNTSILFFLFLYRWVKGIIAGIVFVIYRLYVLVKKKTVVRFNRLLNKIVYDLCLVYHHLKGNEKNFNIFLSRRLWSIRYWNSENEDAILILIVKKDSTTNKLKQNDELNSLLEDFFQIIDTRENALKNNQLQANNGLEKLNCDLVQNIYDIFLKDGKVIAKDVTESAVPFPKTKEIIQVWLEKKKEGYKPILTFGRNEEMKRIKEVFEDCRRIWLKQIFMEGKTSKYFIIGIITIAALVTIVSILITQGWLNGF
jgi:hypothetical protein